MATGTFDILVKKAKLRKKPDNLVEIGISGGKIVAIAEKVDGEAATVIDAGGNLVTESFINAHLHTCKVYTLEMMDDEAIKAYHGSEKQMGAAMTAIELAMKVKENYDEKWIVKNVRKAIAYAGLYGCTHIRTFADVDTKARLEGVKALLRVRDEFKGIVDMQVVAFAQDGLAREPGAEKLVREAMDLGADVVGGIPWIEYTDADIAAHVNTIFDIAEKYDKPVSMLVDDAGDPGLRSIELMALETIKRGWQGRSLAHHCRAAALYPEPYLKKLEFLLKKAQMGWSTAPQTGPMVAPVKKLYKDGVLIFIGQDDISDAYYAFGRNNMLENAFVSAHTLWMSTPEDMEILYDMITVLPGRGIGLKDHEIKEGASANLVVLDQPNVNEALRFHEAPACTISHGKVVDKDQMMKITKTKEW
jgi:cytosine/creatinine deaminase